MATPRKNRRRPNQALLARRREMLRFATRLLAGIVLAYVTASMASGQGITLPAKPAQQANTTAAAQAPDLLGRDTPHGTVVGFLRAAQEEKYSIAAQYFEAAPPRHHPTPEQEQELAEELFTVL